MKHAWIAALAIAAGTSGVALAAEPDWERLDHARTIEEDGMVFVPFKATDRGVFWFEAYEASTTSPAPFSGHERLFVTLVPKAYRDGTYNQLVRRHGVRDARAVWLPGDEPACRPTSALLDLVAPSPYPPRVLASGYPNLCQVSIVYPPDRRAAVQALVAQGRAVYAQLSVPLCAPDSPTYSTRTIANALLAAGVVQPTGGASEYRGGTFAIGYQVGQANFPRDVAMHFYTHVLSREEGEDTAVFRVDPLYEPRYLCKPEPLSISYGDPGDGD